MEATEKQILELEKRIEQVEIKLTEVGSNVDKALTLLDSIDRGLNGDAINDAPGVKQKIQALESRVKELEDIVPESEQVKLLETRFNVMQSELYAIQEKNKSQDIAIAAKRGTVTSWVNIATKVWNVIIVLLTIYFVSRGVFGPDSLIGGHH